MKCGCRVDLEIIFCPLHLCAEEMLERLTGFWAAAGIVREMPYAGLDDLIRRAEGKP